MFFFFMCGRLWRGLVGRRLSEIPLIAALIMSMDKNATLFCFQQTVCTHHYGTYFGQ